ncbi:MAG: decaprenylphospho-beta-D-ribofuranose 2-oxidase [Myxococcota bacterium]|jgi:decaprenylphospho-beta-D-ribofuranose 2-oxidase
MTTGVKTQLMGWGASRRVDCLLDQPETTRELAAHLDEAGTIARGLGRSYGDAALNEGKQVIDLTRINRYCAFDADSGILTCEAGVSLADIIDDFTPRGWFPGITPGTKYVTIGGCIANDVHGKAHHAQGSFAECLLSMTILLASGEVVTASRTELPDLFWATLGGMGLLGVILTATVQLRRVETSYFHKRVIAAESLDEMLEALEEHNDIPYSVAWIDPFATGSRLGRGVLTVGDHAAMKDLPPALRKDPLKLSGPPKITVPFELPAITLNSLSIRLVNLVIEQRLSQKKDLAHYEDFFYPLDAIGHWYRGYGKRGFTQYQFVIPLEDGAAQMRALLSAIVAGGQLPFLNVLKKMGPESGGVLSFPFAGYTFAIDFPIRRGLPTLLEKLDNMVLDAGGRIYLGKDAFLKPATFRAMYPQVEKFLKTKATYDPDNVFTSDLARRIGLLPQ